MLQDLIIQSQEYDTRKADYEPECDTLGFDEQGNVIIPDAAAALFGAVNSTTNPMPMTDHAFSQWRSMFGPDLIGNGRTMSKADWEAIRRTFPEQFAHIANELVQKRCRRLGNKPLLVRTFEPMYEDRHVRALLSDRYTTFDNTDLLQAAQGIIDAGEMEGGSLVRPYVAPDDMHLRITFKAPTGDDNYAIGTHLSNGECGGKSTQVNTLIQTNSCTNSIIVTADAMTRFRHVGSIMAMAGMVKQAIEDTLPLSFEALTRVYEARTVELPTIREYIAKLASDNGFSEKQTAAIHEGTERQHTVLGVINGITWMAHQTIEDQDQRAEAEKLAGRILMQPFNRTQQDARNAAQYADSEPMMVVKSW